MADDDKTICKGLKMYLEDVIPHCMVVTAHDGSTASSKITNQKFDIVVLDINMPKLNGIELVERAQLEGVVDLNRILIISGNFDSAHLGRAKQLGIKHFLVKPFDQEIFLEKIKSVMGI